MPKFKTMVWRSEAVWLHQEAWIEASSVEEAKALLKKNPADHIYDWGAIHNETWIDDFESELEWHEHEDIEEIS